MAVTNTKFYSKDPESQDALDQDDGLNGGSESGSNFWIYALIGVLVIAGIIVLVVCLSGKKSKGNATDFGVPTEGELNKEDTQKFVKAFYDASQKNLVAAAKLEDANKPTKPEDATKLFDDLEQIIKDQLALVKEAEPVADRINKQQDINDVKSVQETVTTFLKLIKEAAEAAQAEIETGRKEIKAGAFKDPKTLTAAELKVVEDLAAKLKTENDQATSKLHAVTQAEPEIKKLFPTETKSTEAKPNKKDD